MFFTFPQDARWNAERQAVEFGVEIDEYRGVVRVPRRVFQRLLPERPTPERCVEAYYLQRIRFESIAERKLRPAGEWVRSFAIITTAPNELCAALHNRMPAVLRPEAWPLWLGEEPAGPDELKALLTPFPSEEMTCWPVSSRVGNVRNNDASLIEPIAA